MSEAARKSNLTPAQRRGAMPIRGPMSPWLMRTNVPERQTRHGTAQLWVDGTGEYQFAVTGLDFFAPMTRPYERACASGCLEELRTAVRVQPLDCWVQRQENDYGEEAGRQPQDLFEDLERSVSGNVLEGGCLRLCQGPF